MNMMPNERGRVDPEHCLQSQRLRPGAGKGWVIRQREA